MTPSKEHAEQWKSPEIHQTYGSLGRLRETEAFDQFDESG